MNMLIFLVFCVVLCFVFRRPVSCVTINGRVSWLSILYCPFSFL